MKVVLRVFKPDIDMVSKPNLEINQWAKYLFNDPLNINTNKPSYNFSCKAYGTQTTLPKDI